MKQFLKTKNKMYLISSYTSRNVLDLILHTLAALLGFKHLNKDSNSSVVKAEFPVGSLRDIKYSVWFISNCWIFWWTLAKERIEFISNLLCKTNWFFVSFERFEESIVFVLYFLFFLLPIMCCWHCIDSSITFFM